MMSKFKDILKNLVKGRHADAKATTVKDVGRGIKSAMNKVNADGQAMLTRMAVPVSTVIDKFRKK